jgi:4-hydroxybenzoate polyprenyltransferase
MRPYLLFVSGAAGTAGIAYGVQDSTPLWLVVLVGLGCFLGYGFGQALTDCTQVDTDSISAPYRPLSKGEIKVGDVAVVSVLGLTLISVFFIIGSRWNLLLGGGAIAGLASYTYFKRRWWFAGPLWNSWIVALLPWIGYVAMRGSIAEAVVDFGLWVLSGATAVAYASFVVIGYLKDIRADRATGYRTFPVVFGWRPTVVLGDVLQLLAAAAFGYLCMSGPWQAWIAWGIGTLLAIRGQLSLPRRSDAKEEEAAEGIAATVQSFVWWNLAVVLHVLPDVWWFCVVYALAFELTLRNRPSASQI